MKARIWWSGLSNRKKEMLAEEYFFPAKAADLSHRDIVYIHYMEMKSTND